MTTGYRLTWGIWRASDHHIMSRDVGNPEVYATRQEAEASLQEKMKNYGRMGYDIWFSNINEIEVVTCKNCGHLAGKDEYCNYCGKKT